MINENTLLTAFTAPTEPTYPRTGGCDSTTITAHQKSYPSSSPTFAFVQRPSNSITRGRTTLNPDRREWGRGALDEGRCNDRGNEACF